MIAGTVLKEVNPENIAKAKEEAVKLKDFLAKQFGFTSEDNFAGVYELIIALYGTGIPQDIYKALKLLYFIEKQISAYLGSLGADLSAVEYFFSGKWL